jgi:hypothetical protein
VGWIRALAGPVLIVCSVLVVLRGYAFGGMLTPFHPDPLSFWLPVHCFLGESIAAGNIPEWNPYVMGGVPFAADPQSGWMYLPAMALYSALPCDVASRWFIVLQPILAGLGLYAFLRAENAARAAATVGGLALGVGVIAGSRVSASLPFAGALAWTSVALWCAARAARAQSWPSRIGWVTALAVAWGQAAAAHMSHGIVVATGAIIAYGAAALGRAVREGRLPVRSAALLGALVLAALPLVNLAFLAPRLAFIPRTSIGLGYDELDRLASDLSPAHEGVTAQGWEGRPSWPGTLVGTPGAYVGVLALAASLAPLLPGRTRRREAAFFAGFGFGCYLLSLGAVASALAPVLSGLPFADFYLQAPGRLSFGTVLALCVLAGFGIDELAHSRDRDEWLRLLIPGAALWAVAGALAPQWGAGAFVVPALGAAAVAIAMTVWSRSPAVITVITGLLAAEVLVFALFGQRAAEAEPPPGSGIRKPIAFWPIQPPDVDAAGYVRPTRIARTLRARAGGRYLSHAPDLFGRSDYRDALRPEHWGLLANQRSILFGIEDVGGYNPTQPLRFWSLARAFDAYGIHYNSAAFFGAPERLFRLLDINYAISRGTAPLENMHAVARDGDWVLYERSRPTPRAEAHSWWTIAGGPDAALADVLSAGARAGPVLEADPGIRPGSPDPPVAARYEEVGPGWVRVNVAVEAPSVVVVRNSYDDNWRAEVDGRPARLLPADYVMQGVAVESGEHEIVLIYDDPWVERGLLGSGAALALLALLAVLTNRRVPIIRALCSTSCTGSVLWRGSR